MPCVQVPDFTTMVDPYMGSGSSILAAKELNRYSIGIEIEEKYCEIAANRCRQSVLELEIPSNNIASKQQSMI